MSVADRYLKRSEIDVIFRQFAGYRIVGGCDACDAYQTVEGGHGVWLIVVHHDDDCPELAARQR